MNGGPRAVALVLAMVASGACAVGVRTTHDPSTGDRTVSVGPQSTRGGPGASAPRTTPPPVGAPRALTLPEPEEWTAPNGLRVVLIRRPALPVVSLQLLFPGGASAHGAAQAGLATFTADMLDEGTRTRSALEIAETVEFLGASLVSAAGYDASSLHLTVLRPRLAEAMEVLGDMVVSPTFPEEDLERVRQERLGRVLQRSSQPGALADDALALALYGTDHPYGAPLLGTRVTLGALTRDDVVAFHRARYLPQQGALVVAGDVTREDMTRFIAESFSGWEGSGAPLRDLPEAPPPDARVVVVDRPGAAQSEVRVGRVALPRGTERYHAAQVANTVLGGSFTSRLNTRLREERGFTYGAFSWFDLRRAPGPFEAGAAVATPVTGEAVAEFMAILDGMSAEPVGAEELERSRSYLALRLPQRFETAADVVGRVAELVLHGVPLDFYEGYVSSVLAVSAQEVGAVAADLLRSRDMVVVVAGDRSVVVPALEALGLGPIRIVEREALS